MVTSNDSNADPMRIQCGSNADPMRLQCYIMLSNSQTLKLQQDDGVLPHSLRTSFVTVQILREVLSRCSDQLISSALVKQELLLSHRSPPTGAHWKNQEVFTTQMWQDIFKVIFVVLLDFAFWNIFDGIAVVDFALNGQTLLLFLQFRF